MSKKTKIALAAAAALLVVVTTFFALLPRLLRWYIPRFIEAKSGYHVYHRYHRFFCPQAGHHNWRNFYSIRHGWGISGQGGASVF